MQSRIKILRTELGMSMSAFGERVGVGSSSISKIETGVNSPSEQTIRAICSEFGVRREWLETGEGDMYAPVVYDDAIGIVGRRMLDDPERTGRLLRAIAAMDDDSWYTLIAKVDELHALYCAAAPPPDPQEP